MAAQSTLTRQANGLVTLFLGLWTDKYPSSQPEINRYRHRWGFQDMVEDLGYEQAKEVIEYYFRISRPGHPIQHLLNNYEKMAIRLREQKKDAADRAILLKETEQRVRELEEKSGNKRSGSN